MSWDIIVQDLPLGIASIAEIPDDFNPKVIGLKSEVAKSLVEAYPEFQVQGASCLSLTLPQIELEVSLGEDEELYSFCLHVYGGSEPSVVIADILNALKMRALDPGSSSGLFECHESQESYYKWQEYRRRICRTYC